MKPHTIQSSFGRAKALGAGTGDYVLIPTDRGYEIRLQYEGEPPHEDSYHVVDVAGRRFLGYAWSCMFSMSNCSNFVAFSWMEKSSKDSLARNYNIAWQNN